MLRLTVGPLGPTPNPATGDIERAVRGLSGGADAFVILAETNGRFIQVAGGGAEEFQLELQFAEDDLRRCCAEHLSVESIVAAFVAFARGDRSWADGQAWEPVELRGPSLAELADAAGVTVEQYMNGYRSAAEVAANPPPPPNAYNSTEGWLFVASNSANDLLYVGFGIRIPKRLERLKEEYGGKFRVIAQARGTRYDKMSILAALDRSGARSRDEHTGGWFPDSAMVRHCLDNMNGE